MVRDAYPCILLVAMVSYLALRQKELVRTLKVRPWHVD